jgi:hypothetical protein
MKVKTSVKAGNNMGGAQTNPLYSDSGRSGTNPLYSP